MTYARLIAFRIYEGEDLLRSDRFLVTREPGTSCFGSYVTIEKLADSKAALFEGLVVHHELDEDGTAHIELNMYEVRESDNPLGLCQARLLQAGICMGTESGADKADSVMLGNDHEFVFQTRVVA